MPVGSAARVGDPFGHSAAMSGVMAGLAVGALIGTAILTGGATVLINGQPAACLGETMDCSAVIRKGSGNVFIGGPSVEVIKPTPEVPAWLDNTMLTMVIGGTVIGTLGVGLAYGAGAAVGSLMSGTAGSYLLGQGATMGAAALGFGATDQAVAGVAGSVLSGYKEGRRYDIAANRSTAHAFYESQGFKPANIPDHVKGIDLRRPVTVETLPQGTRTSQYKFLKDAKANIMRRRERRHPNSESLRRVYLAPPAPLSIRLRRRTPRRVTFQY